MSTLARRPLSRRQLQVLERASYGWTVPEIAEHLALAPSTVRYHLDEAIQALGARSKAHAVAIALTEGLMR